MYLSSQRANRLFTSLILFAVVGRADIIINTTEHGWYDSMGYSNLPLIHQYGAGRGGTDGPVQNNLFVFDLSGIGQTVLTAELRIDSNWYFSTDPVETYITYDVSTDIATLMNGSGGTSAFTDLQSGNSYGSIDISAADNGTTVSIFLNAQAIQDINTSLGGLFAIGGTVSTLDMVTPRQEELFPFSDPNSPSAGVSLVLTTIPEPSVFGLLFINCGILALRKWIR